MVATSTTTLSTSSVCFVSAAGSVACAKRKKRNINDARIGKSLILHTFYIKKVLLDLLKESEDKVSGINPDKIHFEEEFVESGLKDAEEGARRVQRFFNAFYYATSTSTSTSYTGTSTMATLECTPTGFTITACV